MEQQEKERLFSTSQSLEENDPADNIKTFLASESNKLSLPEVTAVLEVLTQRKVLLEAESITAQNKLLYEFLEHLLKRTEQQQSELDKKVRLIKSDMKVSILNFTDLLSVNFYTIFSHFRLLRTS